MTPDGTVENENETAWYEDSESIQADKELAEWAKGKNFADEGAMAKSYRELEKKQGLSYRLPDDLTKLSTEQKAELITKVRSLRNVPAKPEDYVINIAEGVEKDEAFIGAFKAFAHEKGLSSEDVQSLADFYVNAQQGGMEKMLAFQEKEAAAAETQFRMNHGANYEKVMKGIDIARYELAKELGFLYRVEGDEKPHSKLDDALDMPDAKGRKLGNQPAILDLLNMVYTTRYKESSPIPGTQEPGSAGGGAFSHEFYANPAKK